MLFHHQFPAQTAYLDNAASTPPHPLLLAEINELWAHAYHNASAANPSARTLKKNIACRSEQFLADLNVTDAEIVWTSGGTEANNLAILGTASQLGAEIVTSTVEHPSVHAPIAHLEAMGTSVTRISGFQDGTLDLDALRAALSPATSLVSICHVQGETGAVHELCAVRKLMDELAPQARLHVDAVQGLNKVDFPWEEARIDMASFSGHKVHTFGGVGMLLVRNGVEISPILHGGGQQNNLRSGSLDGAGILSFLVAQRALHQDARKRADVTAWNQHLRDELPALRGRDGKPVPCQVLSPPSASPFILNVSFPDYEGAVLMRILAAENIIVSTGSACSAERSGPSRILTALGFSRNVAYGALRISMGYLTTEEEIAAFISGLHDALRSY